MLRLLAKLRQTPTSRPSRSSSSRHLSQKWLPIVPALRGLWCNFFYDIIFIKLNIYLCKNIKFKK
jgi:hypothetical protein